MRGNVPIGHGVKGAPTQAALRRKGSRAGADGTRAGKPTQCAGTRGRVGSRQGFFDQKDRGLGLVPSGP